MDNITANKWIQIGVKRVVPVVIAAVIGAVIWSLITQSGSVDSVKDVAGTVATGSLSDKTEGGAKVSLRVGGGITPGASSFASSVSPAMGKDFEIELPLTATEAVLAGWKDPVLCRVGRGRYFQKGDVAEVEPYFLMYNSEDDLIGIYQFSEFEMPLPWERMDSLKGGGGLTIIDYPHWGLFVYFQDSTRACGTTEAGEGTGTGGGGELIQVKSTPTPVIPPTPTPTAEFVLETVISKTAKLKALSFKVTGDPVAKKIEGTLDRKGTLTLVNQGVVTVTDNSGNTEVLDASSVSFNFDELGTTLSGIATALQDPVDIKPAYIDNLKRRGVSGAVSGADLSELIPTALADVSVTISLWFDDRGRVLRLEVGGAVTPDDAKDTVRVLDMQGF